MRLALAKYALGPLLLLQGRHVRRVTPELPEPAGARVGVAGDGPTLRVLVLGDSAGAGVGTSSQDEALAGRIVAALRDRFRVEYRVVARTGATTASTLRHLESIEAFRSDAVVTSLGVNDVTGGVGVGAFLGLQERLRSVLREKFGARFILVSGLPPMGSFTALPQPLRWYLGARARELDLALAGALSDEAGAQYLPLFRRLDRSLLASDGFHPGPAAQAQWGAAAARRIEEALAGSVGGVCA
jgi:lysophospholipase L1-like esterase